MVLAGHLVYAVSHLCNMCMSMHGQSGKLHLEFAGKLKGFTCL